MAITVMCDKEDLGAVFSESWTKDAKFPIYLKTFAEGLVVSAREINGYDDSDFMATYWNGEKFVETCYASTRGWTYPNHASIDAPADLIAKWKAEEDAKWAAWAEFRRAAASAAYAKKLKVGALVEVVKGRKVPLGTKGYVAAIEANAYDAANEKVKLQIGDNSAWTYANNLKLAA